MKRLLLALFITNLACAEVDPFANFSKAQLADLQNHKLVLNAVTIEKNDGLATVDVQYWGWSKKSCELLAPIISDYPRYARWIDGFENSKYDDDKKIFSVAINLILSWDLHMEINMERLPTPAVIPFSVTSGELKNLGGFFGVLDAQPLLGQEGCLLFTEAKWKGKTIFPEWILKMASRNHLYRAFNNIFKHAEAETPSNEE